jgi:DNA ligase 1
MQRFAALYAELDKTTRTNRKLTALVAYLRQAPAADAAWAVYFLIGRRPSGPCPRANWPPGRPRRRAFPNGCSRPAITRWAIWPKPSPCCCPHPPSSTRIALHTWVEVHLLTLGTLDEPAQKAAMLSAWQQMEATQRLVWNKLITGEFRIGVSQRLMTRALAQFSGAEPAVIAHRLMGDWTPSADFFNALVTREDSEGGHSRPYPFFLAYPLDKGAQELGEPQAWLAEWKWDGIRAQVIKRGAEIFIWSRGEELVTDAFPELAAAAGNLPDGCVLDGEIVAWRDQTPLGLQCCNAAWAANASMPAS